MSLDHDGHDALENRGDSPQALAVWSSLCLDFFKGTAKADVQAVLAVFDGGTPNEGEDVARLLRETGLVSANGAPVRFSPERHLAYVQARNAARSEAHRQLGVARRLHLAHAIQSTVPFESEGEQSRFVTRRGVSAINARVSAFVSAHGKSLGAHPLLRGLRELLQRQMDGDSVWQWEVIEETFTEAGDERFVTDAVALLMLTLVHVPMDLETSRDSGESLRLSWEVSPQASTHHLSRILRLLPCESNLEGRSAGIFVKTAAARTNMTGELDEAAGFGWAAPVAWRPRVGVASWRVCAMLALAVRNRVSSRSALADRSSAVLVNEGGEPGTAVLKGSSWWQCFFSRTLLRRWSVA